MIDAVAGEISWDVRNVFGSGDRGQNVYGITDRAAHHLAVIYPAVSIGIILSLATDRADLGGDTV